MENKQLKNIQVWLDEHQIGKKWKEQEEYMKLVKNCTNTLEDDDTEKVRKKICNELYIGDDDNL